MNTKIFRIGELIFVGVLLLILWSIPLGYLFFADWSGHWVIGGVLCLATLGVTLMAVGEFFDVGGVKS